MTDPRTPEGERIGMSRYCDHLERRVKELEKTLSDIHATATRISFDAEWMLGGIRREPGDYVVMRLGPAKVEDNPF